MKPALPKLVLLTDWELGANHLLRTLQQLAILGSDLGIQHRNRKASTRLFFEQALTLSELCRAQGHPLFINGRIDVALALDAHLHLPGRSGSLADFRSLLPKDKWLSAAVHNEEEMQERHGADFFLISPVFHPLSKPNDARAPLGVEGFERLSSKTSVSCYALGGIDENSAQHLQAPGFACISAIWRSDLPLTVAQRILTKTR